MLDAINKAGIPEHSHAFKLLLKIHVNASVRRGLVRYIFRQPVVFQNKPCRLVRLIIFLVPKTKTLILSVTGEVSEDLLSTMSFTTILLR